MSTNNSSSQRLDYLDAVRAFALLLGIVFHASLSFTPIFIGWAVMDISTSPLITVFIVVSHAFRLELFFLIAGYFSYMNLKKRGLIKFVHSRLVRIILPFIVAWFAIKPILTAVWVMGMQSLRGDVNIVDALKHSADAFKPFWPTLFTGTHLWFLYYLALITTIFLGLYYLARASVNIKPMAFKKMDGLMAWLCQSPLGLVIVAAPTSLVLWHMSHWTVNTPDKSLVPHLPTTLLYLGFFLFGCLLQRQEALLAKFTKFKTSSLLIALISIVACIKLAPYEPKVGIDNYKLFKAAYLFNYALMMWSLVALSLAAFKATVKGSTQVKDIAHAKGAHPAKGFNQANGFNRAKGFNPVIRYISDSAYWLYIIHLPIVIGLQVALAELELSWGIKLPLIVLATLAIALLCYDLVIRPSFIGKILNGTKKPSVLWALIRFEKSQKQMSKALG